MLRELTAQEWHEWQAYLDLEPPPLLSQMSWLAAGIRQTIAETRRDPAKRPMPFRMEDFRTKFGDDGQPSLTRGRQSWKEQKAALFAYAREVQRERQRLKEQKERRKEKVRRGTRR